MIPSSPTPHDPSPEPLYRSPSSLANVSYNARRRRRRLVSATSDNDANTGGDFEDEVHGRRGEQQRHSSPDLGQGSFQLSSSSTGVTMPVGLANWRRVPKSSSSQQQRGGAQGGASGISSGIVGSGHGGLFTDNARVAGVSSRTSGSRGKKGRKKGLGMGMKGTPAKRGWSKSKSKSSNHSRSIGVHSTPIDGPRHRSRSGSQTSLVSNRRDRSSAPLEGDVQDITSSLSSLPTVDSTTDEDTRTLPSDLDSPDCTIPTIPNRPHVDIMSRRALQIDNSAPTDDVFSASYIPVRRPRLPPGVTFEHMNESKEEYDTLVQLAEEEATRPLGSAEGRIDAETRLDDAAIRDKMFPGMIDMLWPVLSSSDLPSSEQISGKDVYHDASALSEGSGGKTGQGYMDFDIPVKGTPYRVGIPSTTDFTSDATATATKRPQIGKASAISLSSTPVPRRLLKSAKKGSKLSSPIKTPMPLRSSLRQTPRRIHAAHKSPLGAMDPFDTDEDNLSDSRMRNGRSLNSDDVTGATDMLNSKGEIIFSFDQPLRGNSPIYDGPAIRDFHSGNDSTPRRRLSTQRTISNRPKTPAALHVFIARKDDQSATDMDSTATSTPVRTAKRRHTNRSHLANPSVPSVRASDKYKDTNESRTTAEADRNIVLEKRPFLDRTLSQLLDSDDDEGIDVRPIAEAGREGSVVSGASGKPRRPMIEVSTGGPGKPRTFTGSSNEPAAPTATRVHYSPHQKDGKGVLDMTLSQLLRSSSQADALSESPNATAETRTASTPPPVASRNRPTAIRTASPASSSAPRAPADRASTVKERSPVMEVSRSARRPPMRTGTYIGIPPLYADDGPLDTDAHGNAMLGDQDDEYQPLQDFLSPDHGGSRERERDDESRILLPRLSAQDSLSPAPWTPSSHRGSPGPTRRFAWQRGSQSSPLTFSRSASPLERLVTPSPPISPSGLSTRRKREQNGHRRNRRGGVWKGRDVLQRMEEADREEAAYWLWVQTDDLKGCRAGNKRKRRRLARAGGGVEGIDQTEVGSDEERDQEAVWRRRKRQKREDVLLALYSTEEARAAMAARVRHYAELEASYDMAVEMVW